MRGCYGPHPTRISNIRPIIQPISKIEASASADTHGSSSYPKIFIPEGLTQGGKVGRVTIHPVGETQPPPSFTTGTTIIHALEASGSQFTSPQQGFPTQPGVPIKIPEIPGLIGPKLKLSLGGVPGIPPPPREIQLEPQPLRFAAIAARAVEMGSLRRERVSPVVRFKIKPNQNTSLFHQVVVNVIIMLAQRGYIIPSNLEQIKEVSPDTFIRSYRTIISQYTLNHPGQDLTIRQALSGTFQHRETGKYI